LHSYALKIAQVLSPINFVYDYSCPVIAPSFSLILTFIPLELKH
jgi:hypothetical protein